MKISFIATVLNEEGNIEKFFASILNQSKLPDEIIIADAGSKDQTLELLTKLQKTSKIKNFKIIQKKGNRSVGRNEAIKRATGDVILCSDSGCVLDKKWIENIMEPFKDKTVDVVAGYYEGKPRSIFEKCLIPYVLVMPDKVNKETFLPAARSMALRKSVWKKIGGFNEKLSHNEDYDFAIRLKKNGTQIIFNKKAIVFWIPRDNLFDSFKMFFRFAYGDGQSGIIRPKVILIFIRYFIVCFLIILYLVLQQYFIINILLCLLPLYILWSITKNYRYVKHIGAFIFLPVLQITSDIAVILGTTFGLVNMIHG